MLRMEAFGKYSPHYPQDSVENRRRNRRVDIVLDKRSIQASEMVREMVGPTDEPVDTMTVDGFEFDVSTPGELE